MVPVISIDIPSPPFPPRFTEYTRPGITKPPTSVAPPPPPPPTPSICCEPLPPLLPLYNVDADNKAPIVDTPTLPPTGNVTSGCTDFPPPPLPPELPLPILAGSHPVLAAEPPPNIVAPNPSVDLPLTSPGIAPLPTLILYDPLVIVIFVPYNTAPPPPPPPKSFPPAPPPPTIKISHNIPPVGTLNVYCVCPVPVLSVV